MNKWLGSGRLTRDMEVRYTPNGAAVGSTTMAVNRFYKNSSGEKVEETCFVDLTLWGPRAESLGQYLTKGKFMMVEGRLQQESWEKDGQKRSKLSVVVDSIDFVPTGNGGGGQAEEQPVETDEEVPF
jgi:single-strand DNA-binding protein